MAADNRHIHLPVCFETNGFLSFVEKISVSDNVISSDMLIFVRTKHCCMSMMQFMLLVSCQSFALLNVATTHQTPLVCKFKCVSQST